MRRAFLAVLLVVFSGSDELLAQVPSAREPFSNYQEDLQTAAETVLAETTASSIGSRAPVASPTPRAVSFSPKKDNFSEFARDYWNSREDDLVAALRRIDLLRPQVEPILREQGVPPQLSAVILIESAGVPDALSPRDARGLWQLVPATARRYGLTVNQAVDERLSVGKSTQAAAQYLRDLHRRFGDWLLTLAAYNAGENAVEEAMARGKTDDFEELSRRRLLPKETRTYIPAILAALDMFNGARGILPKSPLGEKGTDTRVVYAALTR